jgi:hypothetical protein
MRENLGLRFCFWCFSGFFGFFWIFSGCDFPLQTFAFWTAFLIWRLDLFLGWSFGMGGIASEIRVFCGLPLLAQQLHIAKPSQRKN